MVKTLCVIAHAPSPNTLALKHAVLAGAQKVAGVQTNWVAPLHTQPQDILGSDAVILGTTENLGYMAGALKDFFDRCYDPLLDETQGLPFSTYIRAGLDGTGTKRAITSITKGLKWKPVQETLIFKGAWQDRFLKDAEELGEAMAAGLDMGVF
ncbi:MAG: flavodoxin family protein [Pseudomonadota bacterium]